jgi:hypothetical protein
MERYAKAAGVLRQVPNLSKKHVIVAAVVMVIGGVFLWHGQSSLTPEQVSSKPMAQLKEIYVTKGPNVFPLEPAKWDGIIWELGKMKGASSIGYKGDSWGALVCVEVNWGDGGRYWIRLQTRENLGDRIIANMEEPLGSGSFHHKGHYAGAALFKRIMADPPRIKEFPHKAGGPGCPPLRGVKASPLLALKP